MYTIDQIQPTIDQLQYLTGMSEDDVIAKLKSMDINNGQFETLKVRVRSEYELEKFKRQLMVSEIVNAKF